MITIRDLPADGIVREPGFYRMTAAQYHADPCIVPSLSSSTIRLMLERTPAHVFAAHPRLSGAGLGDNSTPAMTFGTAVHALLLGQGRHIAVIDADSYRTKAAQAARDEAEVHGHTPMLREAYQLACNAANAIARRISEIDGCGDILATHVPELVAIWREGDVWCRAQIDLAPQSRDADAWWTAYDLKTTAVALSPVTLARKIVSEWLDVQACFYVRGIEALIDPTARARFRWLFAEVDAPHGVLCATPSGAMMTTAEAKVMAGLSIWSECMRSGNWPAYPREVIRLESPTYLETQWREREEADPLIRGALDNWSKAA